MVIRTVVVMGGNKHILFRHSENTVCSRERTESNQLQSCSCVEFPSRQSGPSSHLWIHLHGFSYPRAALIEKAYMENPRNAQF